MRECIILAGGMGTRLQSVVSDLPKCMAPINGKPFLFYMFRWLEKNQFNRVILSLGYKSGSVIDFAKSDPWPFEIITEVEQEPLGTGGAIAGALRHCQSEQVFILNGDTFFDIDFTNLQHQHLSHEATLTIAAKPLKNYDRYGSLVCEADGRITGFLEKNATLEGIINGGIYLLSLPTTLFDGTSGKFSFETDILEKKFAVNRFFAAPDNGYFIDIGIPEDYRRAEMDFKTLFV